ncbi:MAG: hypothetical protein JST47_10595 [Bacteroidetes bacterium]|nr:hypothetical protein [Bacteroidota bacterium]MBS1972733.1 hypothetical protein [Bacteroidota bacterium]
MNKNYEKLKKKAAAKVLKILYTNELWFDKPPSKKDGDRNYLFIPIFDIAQASKNYNLDTIKDACYLLHQNNHVNIWGEDHDARAMMVQLSDDGAKAHKQFFYGRNVGYFMKQGIALIAAMAMILFSVTGINKFTTSKSQKNQYRNSSMNDAPVLPASSQLR